MSMIPHATSSPGWCQEYILFTCWVGGPPQGLLKVYSRKVEQAVRSQQAARITTELGGTLLLEIELMNQHHPDLGKASSFISLTIHSKPALVETVLCRLWTSHLMGRSSKCQGCACRRLTSVM